MKILHILGAPLHSGAGRGVHALHEALLLANVKSSILGRIDKDSPVSQHVHPIPLNQLHFTGAMNRFFRLPFKLKYRIPKGNYAPLAYGLNFHKLRQFSDAELIHIQWVGADTMSPKFWRALRDLDRPIVWTLRDMWPFTGGCHYSGDCNGYMNGCSRCPMLGDGKLTPISSRQLEFKSSHISGNITFVAISDHIAEQAKRSIALKDSSVQVIVNSVMIDKFKSISKIDSRGFLNLPKDKFILAAGALNLADTRKGSRILAELIHTYRNCENIHWVLFGSGADKLLSRLPDNCTVFGAVHNDRKLNQIYSAADLFIMPSLQESFGKVTIEAMASGTPVIAFDNTPAVEMLEDGITGWLVPHGDTNAIINKIDHVQQFNKKQLQHMSHEARERAISRYSTASYTQNHISLYERLIYS